MMGFTKHVYKRQNQATKNSWLLLYHNNLENSYKFYKLLSYGTVLNSQFLQKHIIIKLNDYKLKIQGFN